MDPEIEKIIKEQMKKLPKEVRDIIANPTLSEKISAIGRENGLNEEQIGTLGTETYLALLGLVPLDEYEKILREKLPKDSIEILILDINESILKNIWPQLIDVYYEEKEPTTLKEEKIDQELDARLKDLPRNIQEAIVGSNYYGKLYGIAKENNLSVAQTGALEECTTDAVLGAITQGEFAESIKKRTGVPTEVSNKIANDISEKILKEIRGKIMTGGGEGRKIFESAGIHINGDAVINEVAKPKMAPLPRPDLKLPELSGKVTPAPLSPTPVNPNILNQKFSDTFKMNSIKTEHTPDNTSKTPSIPQKAYPKNADPYRLPPE